MSNLSMVNLVVRKEDLLSNKHLFSDAAYQGEHDGLLMSLTYYDVQFAILDIEKTLQENRVPYDKCWDKGDELPCGTEYCRVLSDGSIVVKGFSGVVEDAVHLDDVIQAYKQGDIINFLESKKNEITVMSWDNQEVIMQARAATKTALLNLDQETLDSLVVEMSCELSSEINQTNDEVQEEAILLAEQRAVDINNQGKEKQITYLLNSGYLYKGTSKHIVTEYALFGSSDDLWLRDDIQFPRLISEIAANFRINGEEYVDLKDSMSLDDTQINELFKRAEKAWEQAKGVGNINTAPENITFLLKDEGIYKGGGIAGYSNNSLGLGLALYFDGYSDCCSQDNRGAPIYIERFEGNLRAIIYADINQEEPTHIISLESAKTSKRIEK